MSANPNDVDASQFHDGDWFTLAAMLLYKLGGSVELTTEDTLGPLGKQVSITRTPTGMHMALVDAPADA